MWKIQSQLSSPFFSKWTLFAEMWKLFLNVFLNPAKSKPGMRHPGSIPLLHNLVFNGQSTHPLILRQMLSPLLVISIVSTICRRSVIMSCIPLTKLSKSDTPFGNNLSPISLLTISEYFDLPSFFKTL